MTKYARPKIMDAMTIKTIKIGRMFMVRRFSSHYRDPPTQMVLGRAATPACEKCDRNFPDTQPDRLGVEHLPFLLGLAHSLRASFHGG
jgi:hypothetical protein